MTAHSQDPGIRKKLAGLLDEILHGRRIVGGKVEHAFELLDLDRLEAVAIGRLYCYALAAAGAPGIVRMFELLENEVISALGLAGAASFKDLTPAHLHFGEPLVTEPSVFSAFPLLNLDDPGYGGR